MPHARHLAQVLAQHEFQEALKNYRDLRFLTRRTWRIGATSSSSSKTCWRPGGQGLRPTACPQTQSHAKAAPRASMRSRSGATTLARTGHARPKPKAMASPLADDQAARALLARVKDSARRLVEDPNAERRDRVPCAAAPGSSPACSAWQLAQDFTGPGLGPRRRSCKTHRRRAWPPATQRSQALTIAQAERDEPARFDRFAQRIAAITPVAAGDDARASPASSRRATHRGAGHRRSPSWPDQQERIASATLTQARFALAQLYDRSYAKADEEPQGKLDGRPSRRLRNRSMQPPARRSPTRFALCASGFCAAVALSACSSWHSKGGSPDNEPTLKTLARRRKVDGRERHRPSPAADEKQSDRGLSQVSRHRPAARRSAPKRCAASATSRWTGRRQPKSADRRRCAGASDYKAAITRYQDYLRTYPKDPNNDQRALPDGTCLRAGRRSRRRL